eukprot:COSAG03_NODE_8875_length_763_cov_4.230422_1_plen_95_part_10
MWVLLNKWSIVLHIAVAREASGRQRERKLREREMSEVLAHIIIYVVKLISIHPCCSIYSGVAAVAAASSYQTYTERERERERERGRERERERERE